MQETTKECRKELQKYKVTNWVNGQRSRQFGMAGHVIRKTDGRWAKALINWYMGKPTGRNTTKQYWEHDIEAWIKQKFPLDHSTWQQMAGNSEQWTKWRDEYAAQWPGKSTNSANEATDQSTKHRSKLEAKKTKEERATKDGLDKVKGNTDTNQQNSEDHRRAPTITAQIVHQQKEDQTSIHFSRDIPVPGGKRRRLTIKKSSTKWLSTSTEPITELLAAGCCPHSGGKHMLPSHAGALGHP